MLLFLGVVTLVCPVAWNRRSMKLPGGIDHLAEQIMRLDQVISDQNAQLKEARRREHRRSRLSRDDQAGRSVTGRRPNSRP